VYSTRCEELVCNAAISLKTSVNVNNAFMAQSFEIHQALAKVAVVRSVEFFAAIREGLPRLRQLYTVRTFMTFKVQGLNQDTNSDAARRLTPQSYVEQDWEACDQIARGLLSPKLQWYAIEHVVRHLASAGLCPKKLWLGDAADAQLEVKSCTSARHLALDAEGDQGSGAGERPGADDTSGSAKLEHLTLRNASVADMAILRPRRLTLQTARNLASLEIYTQHSK